MSIHPWVIRRSGVSRHRAGDGQEEERVSKVVVVSNLTLDGVMQAPGRTAGGDHEVRRVHHAGGAAPVAQLHPPEGRRRGRRGRPRDAGRPGPWTLGSRSDHRGAGDRPAMPAANRPTLTRSRPCTVRSPWPRSREHRLRSPCSRSRTRRLPPAARRPCRPAAAAGPGPGGGLGVPGGDRPHREHGRAHLPAEPRGKPGPPALIAAG